MAGNVWNWSEVLEQYRGKSIKKKKNYELAKWSEIGSQYTSRKKRLTHSTKNEKHIQPPRKVIVQEPIDERIDDNNVLVRSKLKTMHLDSSSRSDKPPKTLRLNEFLSNKPSLLEIFYDNMMQDSDSIPTLYASGKLEENNKLWQCPN